MYNKDRRKPKHYNYIDYTNSTKDIENMLKICYNLCLSVAFIGLLLIGVMIVI